jgi:outer membrane protein TolC
MNHIAMYRGILPRTALIGLLCLAGTPWAAERPASPLLLAPPGAALPPGTQPPALTLDQAVRLAMTNQPQLARLSARVHEANESALAEGELPDPRLVLGLSSLPVDTFSFTQEDMTQAMIGISQMIPGGNKRELASQRMRVEAGRMEAELEATRRRIVRDTAQAWMNLYYPGQALGLLERIDLEYGREMDWATVALATGGMSQADTLALRMMRAYLQDQIAGMRREEARARAELQRWTGTTGGSARAGGDLPAAPASEAPPPDQRLDAHPDLSLMRQGVALARSEANLAREAYKPDWAIDVAYGVRGGGRTDMVSVQVGVELPVFTKNRQDRRLSAKLAAVDGVESELEDRRRELAAGLAVAQADWQAAEQRITHFEKELLPLAQRRVESTLATYRTGKAAFSTVLEARRAELEARMQLLAQQVARARAAIDLRYYLADTAHADKPASLAEAPTTPRSEP